MAETEMSFSPTAETNSIPLNPFAAFEEKGEKEKGKKRGKRKKGKKGKTKGTEEKGENIPPIEINFCLQPCANLLGP